MKGMAQSRYIRFDNPSELVRRWIAIILLKADLESHLLFSRIEPSIIRGFDTSVITKENREDAAFMRAWLTSERDACNELEFDERDVFAINTTQISRSMGLNSIELAILRLGCLINCFRPLDAAADICGDMFTEVDLCDLLSELLEKPFQAVYDALHPSGLLRKSGLVRPRGGWTNSRSLSGWLTIPETLARQVFRVQENDDILLNAFYRCGPKSTLTLPDFNHMLASCCSSRITSGRPTKAVQWEPMCCSGDARVPVRRRWLAHSPRNFTATTNTMTTLATSVRWFELTAASTPMLMNTAS